MASTAHILQLSLLFVISLTCCHGARILLVPWPFMSHVGQYMTVGEGLVERGHDVHLLTTPTLPSLDKVKKSAMKVILYEADEPDFYTTPDEEITDLWTSLMSITLKEDFRTSIKGFKEFCNNPLKDKKLFLTLKSLKFDIAIVDSFPCGRCLLVLMHRLGLPYINLITFPEPWLLRSPALPSATPFILGENAHSEKMDFWERLDNIWSLIDWTVFTGVSYLEDEYLKEYFYETTPVPLDELAGRAQLWLIDQTIVMDYPKPRMPNEINVGGLTIKPAKPLPKDLEKFASSNPNGFIIVSFGSMGTNLPQAIFEELVAAFEKVKYNVIMRYNLEKVGKVSPHIKFVSWLPQNDLLGHRMIKLFVTHGGANSQTESLYHGVPMLTFPFFAEQHYNALRSTYHGFGLHMNLQTFKAADLVANIDEVIENSTYRENILVASAIFKDQPTSPRDTALYWIEHVIQHGGQHLRSHALDMVWYEYLMLDILAFVFAIITVLVVIAVCIVRKATAVMCGGKKKEKTQ